MNVSGEKVLIRDWVEADAFNESIWEVDAEIKLLDPPAGMNINIQRFSIETLSGIHIGSCTLYNRTFTDVQLGIRIGIKDYWGKGYGTEAVNLLVAYALRIPSTEGVWLKVLPNNIRAIKCYEKCGFTQTGRLLLSGYDFIIMEIRRT